MTDRNARIQQLRQRRDELQKRLDAIKADYRRGLSADSDEQAIELENADVLAEIGRVAANELAQVEQELRQLGVA